MSGQTETDTLERVVKRKLTPKEGGQTETDTTRKVLTVPVVTPSSEREQSKKTFPGHISWTFFWTYILGVKHFLDVNTFFSGRTHSFGRIFVALIFLGGCEHFFGRFFKNGSKTTFGRHFFMFFVGRFVDVF